MRWHGIIGYEGQMTGDGRFLDSNSLRWDNLPIPLAWAPADLGQHAGAVDVGTIETIQRRKGGAIYATGTFDMGSENGREAARLVAEKITRGISMDLDDTSFEVRVPSELLSRYLLAKSEMDPEDIEVEDDGSVVVARMTSKDEVRFVTDSRLRRATLVSIPAFATALIEIMSEEQEETLVASALLAEERVTLRAGDRYGISNRPWNGSSSRFTEAQWYDSCLVHLSDDKENKSDHKLPIREPNGDLSRAGVHAAASRLGQVQAPKEILRRARAALRSAYRELEESPPASVRASLVAGAFPVEPPSDWFKDPRLDGPTPLSIDKKGRVYGHLAVWGTCHAAFPGSCVAPPSSPSRYSHFLLGAVRTSEGVDVPVGHITMDTMHAGRSLSPAGTLAHYEDTGRTVADVAAGEDSWGIWVAGALRPEVTDEQIRTLRGSPLSGDWRRVGGHLELVAALAVNVPGFPIPRPAGLVASGAQVALVASGIVAPDIEDRLDQEDRLAKVRSMQASILAERVFARGAQPRAPRGSSIGGQWIKSGGGGAAPFGGLLGSVPPGSLSDFQGGSLDPHLDKSTGRIHEERVKGVHEKYVTSTIGKRPKDEVKEAVFMGGGPGSGKGTLVSQTPELLSDRFVPVNPDEAKEFIPEYLQGKAAKNPQAALFAHEESSYMSKVLTDAAAREGYDVLVDGVGDSGIAKVEQKVKSLRDKGYAVKGKYVTVDTEEALLRSVSASHNPKSSRYGRLPPIHYTIDAHADVSRTLAAASDRGTFDTLELWDTSSRTPKKILEQGGGGTAKVLDQKAWDSFVAKGTKTSHREVIDSTIERAKIRKAEAPSSEQSMWGATIKTLEASREQATG